MRWSETPLPAFAACAEYHPGHQAAGGDISQTVSGASKPSGCAICAGRFRHSLSRTCPGGR